MVEANAIERSDNSRVHDQVLARAPLLRMGCATLIDASPLTGSLRQTQFARAFHHEGR
jgi:hypothetical protein